MKLISAIATGIVAGTLFLSPSLSVSATAGPAASITAATNSGSSPNYVLKVHDDCCYDYHSRYRSHYRWGSYGCHNRYRSHCRWGSHRLWHNGWRSHRRWGSEEYWHSRWRSHGRWSSEY